MGTPDRPPEPGTAGKDARKAGRPARRGPRRVLERGFLRLVGTAGIVGIGVVIGAVLADNKVQGWVIGLVVSVVTIVLVVVLSFSRTLRREG